MPATMEMDRTLVPDGFIGTRDAAAVIGCNEEFLLNRRWVRRQGLPALQLRRGWPIFFDEKKLREWCAKRYREVKPERRDYAAERRRRKANAPHKTSGAS